MKLSKGVVKILGALFLIGGTSFSSQVVLRLSENQPPSNPVTKSMIKFAELVQQKSEGEVKVEVYHSGQLGEETESIEQTQMGIIDLTRVNSVPLSQTVKEMGVVTLPYVFTSTEHKYKVLDGEVGAELLKSLEKYGLVGLGYLEAGSRNFYTTKPVNSIKDLKGMKIRVQPSEISIKMTQLIGAVPTPMNYGEVYSSLQTGVIDGAENDFVSFDTSSHYEVAKYLILDGHLSTPALLLMNKEKFDSLTEKQKKAIREASNEAIVFERKAMMDMQLESEKKVVASGVKITKVDVLEFQNAVKSIYDSYPQYKENLEKIKNIK